VPPIWPLEVGNVLLAAARRQRVRSEDLRSEDLNRIISQLAMLPIQVDEDSTDRALGEVFTLAAQHGLTTYDAAYLELAQRRQLPLATLDRRLREACAALKIAVLPESNRSNEP
jgi:predicted nucleic acid-binding protein